MNVVNYKYVNNCGLLKINLILSLYHLCATQVIQRSLLLIYYLFESRRENSASFDAMANIR